MATTSDKPRNVYGATLSRREFVKAGGTLVVGFALAGPEILKLNARKSATFKNSLNPALPSSWIEIHPDNTILIRTGKNDFGQGTTFTAYRQIVAEELSAPLEAITTVVQGTTDRTPDGSGAFDFRTCQGESDDESASGLYEFTTGKRCAINIPRLIARGCHRSPLQRHDRGGMLYSVDDRGVASAPAQVRRRPGFRERLFDLRHGRTGVVFEQFGGLDDHSALAEAAQGRLLVDPCLLDRTERVFCRLCRKSLLLCPSGRQAFQRGDFLIADGRNRRDAGTRFFATDQNRTGPTLRQPASELRPG